MSRPTSKSVSPVTVVPDEQHAASALVTLDAPKNRDAPTDDDAVVELDVGGCKFKTTRQTLCRIQGTFFESMFSGRHANNAIRNQDGSYFVDRDGTHFKHILNFLRVGSAVTMPRSDEEKEELTVEADYYGLIGLVRAMRAPKVDVNEHLSEKVFLQREQEDHLRKAFCHKEVGGLDPFEGLIPIFDQNEGIAIPLKYNPECKAQNKGHLYMDNLRKNRDSLGENPAVTVSTLDEFKTCFNREWPNVLHRINDVLLQEPIVIAGGSVLRAMTSSENVRTGGDWWGTKTSDIDLFLYCREPSEANRIAERIFRALASADNEKWVVIRSRGVINIHRIAAHGSAIETTVQIVLRLYDSPTEVLVGFDVDCCLCAYDGRNVWLAPRCISALETGINILNPLHAWPNRPSYELRLGKYAHRGFAVSVPGIDKNRIDYDSIHRSELGDLKGLGRFIKVATEMERAPPRYEWVRVGPFPHRRRTAHARAPENVDTLRESVRGTLAPDERLVQFGLGYPDHDRRGHYNDITDVIVPRVYVDALHLGSAQPVMWSEYFLHDFPFADDSRDEGWAGIVDGGEDCPESVPRLLVDAWDMGKRSREYLNGKMDKYDFDNLYYSQAYNDEEN